MDTVGWNAVHLARPFIVEVGAAGLEPATSSV